MKTERFSRRKHCETCNSWVPIDRVRCPNCGAGLPALPDTVPIEVAPDGHLLSEYVAGQLDGVDDPRARIARLLAIRWDLERSIETGAITYPHQIDHARAFMRTTEQDAAQYLAMARVANRHAAVSWAWRGLACLAVGIVLVVVAAATLGGIEALVMALVSAAVALMLWTVAAVLRFRAPALPHPERRPPAGSVPAEPAPNR